jgi:hypothetical protein
MRLLRVELIRLFSRRACVVLLAVGTIGVGLISWAYLESHSPPSATEVAFATRMVEREANSPRVARSIARCEAGKGGYVPDFNCEKLRPTAEDFMYVPKMTLTGQESGELTLPIVFLLAVMALLVGATYIGADWSAGTVSTLLLFESRRGRVWLAKASALFAGTAVLAAVVLAAALAVAVAFGVRWDVLTATDGLAGDLTMATLRAAVLVGLAALSGFAVVMALRFTAAALGVVLAYTLVGEALLRNFWDGSEAYLLSNHVFAVLLGKWRTEVWPTSCPAGDCRPQMFHFTATPSSLYLAGLTAVSLAISYAVFARRDVA